MERRGGAGEWPTSPPLAGEISDGTQLCMFPFTSDIQPNLSNRFCPVVTRVSRRRGCVSVEVNTSPSSWRSNTTPLPAAAGRPMCRPAAGLLQAIDRGMLLDYHDFCLGFPGANPGRAPRFPLFSKVEGAEHCLDECADALDQLLM